METLAQLIFGPAIQTELSGLHRLATPIQSAGSRDAQPVSSRSRASAGDTRALCVPMLTQLRRLIAPVAGHDWDRQGSEHTWLAAVREAAASESILALDPDAAWDAALGVMLASQRALADTLTWAVYLLATHPDVRRRLAAEAIQVHGTDGVRVARGHLQVEAERVLAETLRLFPPVPWAVRVTAAGTVLGGHAIRSGATCLVPVQLLQRDPRWHSNPDEFRPDRFAGPSADTTARAYQPFGGDPATCILRQFVMLGGALVLATLLQRYDWTLVDPFSPPSTEALATWRWTQGPFVQLHARHRSAVHWRVPKVDGK
jgi:cytochrome P450